MAVPGAKRSLQRPVDDPPACNLMRALAVAAAAAAAAAAAPSGLMGPTGLDGR